MILLEVIESEFGTINIVKSATAASSPICRAAVVKSERRIKKVSA